MQATLGDGVYLVKFWRKLPTWQITLRRRIGSPLPPTVFTQRITKAKPPESSGLIAWRERPFQTGSFRRPNSIFFEDCQSGDSVEFGSGLGPWTPLKVNEGSPVNLSPQEQEGMTMAKFNTISPADPDNPSIKTI